METFHLEELPQNTQDKLYEEYLTHGEWIDSFAETADIYCDIDVLECREAAILAKRHGFSRGTIKWKFTEDKKDVSVQVFFHEEQDGNLVDKVQSHCEKRFRKHIKEWLERESFVEFYQETKFEKDGTPVPFR